MPKEKLNITDNVMSRIQSGRIHMKPRWYFLLGSAGLIVGFVGLAVMSVFLVSLITFSLRSHGPMAAVRYQQLLSVFPWWAPITALIGLAAGIFLLKKFDFSYKKNFLLVVTVFIGSIILAGFVINYLGIDNLWVRRGMMRRFYQQYDGSFNRPGWATGSGLFLDGQGRHRVY